MEKTASPNILDPPLPFASSKTPNMQAYFLILLTHILYIFHIDASATYTPCTSPTTELQIRNRLALFALALDIDDFSLLDEVFTNDVSANFGPTPTYMGLQAVEAAQEYLTNVTTQIIVGTIVVNCTDQQRPESVSYFIASNFINDTQLVVGHGKYFDRWVEESEGIWKIRERQTSLFVSIVVVT